MPAPENLETLTLEDRREWVAEVVAPRVEALDGTAEELAGMQPPAAVRAAAGGFYSDIHRIIQGEMTGIVAFWRNVVFAAESGQSEEELNAANEVFVRVQNEAADSLESQYDNNWLVSDEIRAALSQPQDCGILNETSWRSTPAPTP